jgi:hypothetical protein
MKRSSLTLGMILTALLALGLAGCFPLAPVAGSGRAETRSFDLAGFNRVEGANAFQMSIQQGDEFSVKVTADDNLWDRLDISQSGQTLRVGLKPGMFVTRAQLQANVTMPALTGLGLSGAAHATLRGFRDPAPQLSLSASGASQIDGEMNGGATTIDLSGASRIVPQGASQSVLVSASGASTADLTNFPVDRADVRLSGASNATVPVKSSLDYDLSGASNLTYTGSPTVGRSQTSGASSATHR